MQAISDLIKEKAESDDIQISRAQELTTDKASWLRAKKFIDYLSADYSELFRDLITNNKGWEARRQNGKKTHIILEKKFEEHQLLLELVEDENKIPIRVTYFALEKGLPGSSAYYRDVLGNLWKTEEK